MPEAFLGRAGVPERTLLRVGLGIAVGKGNNGFDKALGHDGSETEVVENDNIEASVAGRVTSLRAGD